MRFEWMAASLFTERADVSQHLNRRGMRYGSYNLYDFGDIYLQKMWKACDTPTKHFLLSIQDRNIEEAVMRAKRK